jgi:glycosyltransferase involved in cell wall biosynthesis
VNWPERAFVFGMMSQWVPWKRVDLFVDAACQAAAAVPSAFFVLCGAAPPGKDSSLRSRYSRALGQIGLVMDWTPHPAELLNSIDCLAHPAEAEAFGRVVAEAMSCGKPVVAARAGALPELVLDGATGCLFAPGNAGALAAAMIQMARNPDRAVEMGRAGRIRAERAFGPEGHAASVQDLYRDLMERPASQRRRP